MPMLLDDARADWNRPISLRCAWMALLICAVLFAGVGGWLLHAYVTGGR